MATVTEREAKRSSMHEPIVAVATMVGGSSDRGVRLKLAVSVSMPTRASFKMRVALIFIVVRSLQPKLFPSWTASLTSPSRVTNWGPAWVWAWITLVPAPISTSTYVKPEGMVQLA